MSGENQYIPEAYNTNDVNTFNMQGDGRFHLYNTDYTDTFRDEKTDVYQTVANYAQLAHLLQNNDGYFLVMFGGPWCPNTQAVSRLTNEIAKKYGIDKIYMFDMRLDNGIKIAGLVYDENGNIIVTPKQAFLASALNTRNADAEGAMYNFNFLYAHFLNEFLPNFNSEWNYGVTFNITSNGVSSDYSRMCVPCVMLFDGSGEGNARLVDFVEAEYIWSETSIEGSAQNSEWTAAIENLFAQNPYHEIDPTYVPDSGGGEEGSVSPAPPPAADAGGC